MTATPFRPAFGLSNPHVQTIVSSMGRRVWVPDAETRMMAAAEARVVTVDGVKLLVHFNLVEDAPLIMIVPGWLGSFKSSYVLSAARALGDAGFSVARLNLRDHGDTAHLNRSLFHSAMIDEVVSLVRTLSAAHGQHGAGLLGYSLGGNFALRVARAIPGLSTLAVCPAIEPENTMHSIDRNPVYQRYFVGKWRKTWAAKQAAFPGEFDFGNALKLTSVSALTDYFVRYHSPFDTTRTYFDAYDLSGQTLADVDAQILAARVDPIIPYLQYTNLPANIGVHLTDRGGHGAYLKGWDMRSWADDYAIRYFKSRLTN